MENNSSRGPSASEPVVFLHIGAMKTGTTFLQQLMSANKEDLLKAGFLFPGDSGPSRRWPPAT